MEWKIKKKVENARDLEERVQKAHPEDHQKDAVIFDEEVTFQNGIRMAIQVCNSNDPNESAWTQGVLFSPEGHELGCTDVGESFLGEYCIPYENDDYIVIVEA